MLKKFILLSGFAIFATTSMVSANENEVEPKEEGCFAGCPCKEKENDDCEQESFACMNEEEESKDDTTMFFAHNDDGEDDDDQEKEPVA
jgi:hypothetical protein